MLLVGVYCFEFPPHLLSLLRTALGALLYVDMEVIEILGFVFLFLAVGALLVGLDEGLEVRHG